MAFQNASKSEDYGPGGYTSQNFRLILEELSQTLGQFGVTCLPYQNPTLPWFKRLNEAERKSAFYVAFTYLRICASTISEGASLRDNRVFLWRGLKELGLYFDNDLFDRIKEEDLIEVYSSSHIGLFRNLKFYDYISYPMEEIFCRSWPDLFNRPDENKTLKLIEAVGSLFVPNGARPVDLSGLGFHRVIETDSPERLKMDVLVKSVQPLFNKDHKVFAYVAVEQSISRGSIFDDVKAPGKKPSIPNDELTMN